MSIDTGGLAGGQIYMGGQNLQQIVYPMTTVVQGDSGQLQKAQGQVVQQVVQQTPPQDNRMVKGYQNQKRGTAGGSKKGSGSPGSTRKKRTWKSLVLRKYDVTYPVTYMECQVTLHHEFSCGDLVTLSRGIHH